MNVGWAFEIFISHKYNVGLWSKGRWIRISGIALLRLGVLNLELTLSQYLNNTIVILVIFKMLYCSQSKKFAMFQV